MLWLLLVSALLFLACVAYAYSAHGVNAVLAALLASLACLVGAWCSLLCVGMTTGTANALSGTLLSIFLRTGFPFFVAILIVQASKPLADAGLFAMVLFNYLVVLAVETVLAVRIVQANSSSGGSAVNG